MCQLLTFFNILGLHFILSYLSVLISCQCDIGWTPGGNYCYKILNPSTSMAWAAVEQECNRNYGNVPSFQTATDWSDFQQWFALHATAISTSPVAVGYQMYNTNQNSTFIDINIGLAPTWTIPWSSGQPSTAITWACIKATPVPQWQWQTVQCSGLTIFSPICQQGQLNASVGLCSTLCRSASAPGHVFTLDTLWCPMVRYPSEHYPSFGTAIAMHYPGVTEKATMVSKSGGSYILVYGLPDLITLGASNYFPVRQFYMLKYAPDTPSTQYAVIWNTDTNPTDSLLVPFNIGEYNLLVNDSTWKHKHIAYMPNAPTSGQTCSVSKNCEWNNWNAWSSCTTTCGAGNQTRTRSISLVEHNGGTCDNIFSSVQPCPSLPPCPIDCQWNTWSNWMSCSVTCGTGTQYRNRTKLVVETFGGTCSGQMEESQQCNTNLCPINCTWTTWSVWSSCSLSCNNGTQYKSRYKNIQEQHSGSCDNQYNATQHCNTFPCPIDCLLAEWSQYSTCSVTCGQGGTQIRQKTVLIHDQYDGVPCSNDTLQERSCLEIPECKSDPMSEDWRTVAITLQTLGCTTLIGLLSVVFCLFLVLRIFTLQRLLHMCQEIALITAHIFVVLFAFKSQTDNYSLALCVPAAVFLQYFFIAYYTFASLECVQTYCILTNVTISGSLFKWWKYILVGFGLPLVICLPSGLILYKYYESQYSCWTNWGVDYISAISMLSIFLLSAIGFVLVEAAGMQERKPLPDTDPNIHRSALISRFSMLIIIPLHTSSWIFGTIAVYSQHEAYYPIVFALNVSIAIVICIFHITSDKTVLKFVLKFWSTKICKKKSRTTSASE